MASTQPSAQGASGSCSTSTPVIEYAEPSYWERRYSRRSFEYEWFIGYTALRRVIRQHIPKKKPCLHVGCGASNLQEGMAKAGFTVVNTDISSTLIQQLKAKHAHYPSLTYHVSDCRTMPEFKECQFGSVIDKGTLDALLCCKDAQVNARSMFSEISRVLQPGGVFLLLTLGDPSSRLPMLTQPEYKWQVSLLLLPKIERDNQASEGGSLINDSLKPLQVQGPYLVEGTAAVGLPQDLDKSKYFYAYVCKRDPLQLAAQCGQRLHNGWVEESREVFERLQQELGLPKDLLQKGKRMRKLSLRDLPELQRAQAPWALRPPSPAPLPRPQSAPSISSMPGAAEGGDGDGDGHGHGDGGGAARCESAELVQQQEEGRDLLAVVQQQQHHHHHHHHPDHHHHQQQQQQEEGRDPLVVQQQHHHHNHNQQQQQQEAEATPHLHQQRRPLLRSPHGPVGVSAPHLLGALAAAAQHAASSGRADSAPVEVAVGGGVAVEAAAAAARLVPAAAGHQQPPGAAAPPGQGHRSRRSSFAVLAHAMSCLDVGSETGRGARGRSPSPLAPQGPSAPLAPQQQQQQEPRARPPCRQQQDEDRDVSSSGRVSDASGSSADLHQVGEAGGGEQHAKQPPGCCPAAAAAPAAASEPSSLVAPGGGPP